MIKPSSMGPAAFAASAFEPLESRRMMAVGPMDDDGAVRLQTNMGPITILLSDATPLTRDNFLGYVNAGRFNNTVFHRSVADFVIQGGGFEVGPSYPDIGRPSDDTVDNEFEEAKAAAGGGDVNVRGTVAMAKLGNDPNSATSEFFISVANNAHRIDQSTGRDNGLDVQNGGFTVFGRVLGGGIHVADTINNLQVVDATAINPVFSDLPVIGTNQGFNPVVVESATARRTREITLDNQHRSVTWTDANGTTSTISLSNGGLADLIFVGGADMGLRVQGNRVIVTGKGVTLEEVTARGTTKQSVLSIDNPANRGTVGTIVVASGAHLARIDADSVQLLGDISSAGSIGSIDLRATDRSTISTVGGTLALNIGEAVSTSVNVDKGVLGSMVARRWVDNGQVATSITAKRINSLDITGNFSSNITSTGNINSIVINGNVGHLGPSTWTVVRGSLKSAVIRDDLAGLRIVAANGAINDFQAGDVFTGSDGTDPVENRFLAKSIGRFSVDSLQSATISGDDGVSAVVVDGPVETVTVTSKSGNVQRVDAKRSTNLVVTAPKGAINQIIATDVKSTDTISGSRFSARYIGSVTANSLSLTTITAGAKGLKRVDVATTIDSSVIRSEGSIESVSAKRLTGSAGTQSVIYAGVRSTIATGIITLPTQFTNRTSSIGNVTIGHRTANASIAAPILGTLRLGSVRVVNGQTKFGVTARERIGSLVATTSKGRAINMPQVSNQAQVTTFFSRNNITANDLKDFEVRVV